MEKRKYFCPFCFRSYSRFSTLRRHQRESLGCSDQSDTIDKSGYNSTVQETLSGQLRLDNDEKNQFNETSTQHEVFSNCYTTITIPDIDSREHEECEIEDNQSNGNEDFNSLMVDDACAQGNIDNLQIADDFNDSKNSPYTSTSEYSNSSSDEDLDEAFWLYESRSAQKSKITVMDHITSVLSYSIRHKISDKGVNDLIKLIDLHLPPSNNRYGNSIKTIKKKLTDWMHLEPTVVEYCEICHALWPSGDKQIVECQTIDCTGLRYSGTDQSKEVLKTYFLTSSVGLQLKTILERPGMWGKIRRSISKRMEKRSSDDITDIIDGELCRTHPILSSDENSISLSWNTDGLVLFKSSRVDLWPVYIIINEIPPQERFCCKNIVLWGIWQGKGKPPTNAFFQPFVSAMEDITSKGIDISVTINNRKVEKHIKACPIVAVMDLIAKSQFLNMIQHNGYFGCCTCRIEGKHVSSGKGQAHMYSYRESTEATMRNAREFLQDSIKSSETSKSVFGIKGPSMLLALRHFDIVNGVVPDYMHGVLLGITKTLLSLWFDAADHKKSFQENGTYPEYFIGHLIDDVDSRLLKMKPPSEITRTPRPLKGNFHSYKANECRNWLLYYAIPCLENILPEAFWNHLCLLCESMHILLSKSISSSNLTKADYCLKLFYRQFNTLYINHNGKCGLNVHNLTHLAHYVQQCGPMWAWSCFSFEGFNGIILGHVHGTKNVCRQAMESFNTLRNIYAVADSSLTSDVNKAFLNDMLYSKISATWTRPYNQIAIPNNGTNVSSFIIEKFESLTWLKDAKMLYKAEIMGQVYVGESKKSSSKYTNHLCLVKLDGKTQIFSIDCFLYSECQKDLFVVGSVITRTEKWSVLQEFVTSHIMRRNPTQKENQTIICAAMILEKLFDISGNASFQCIARFPNCYEKD